MLKNTLVGITILLISLVGLTAGSTSDARDVAEINCLAENIYYEARGEQYLGKVAVANVTMNRVKQDGFPDTVCDVVKQKTGSTCQFSWVCKRLHTREPKVGLQKEVELATAVYYGLVDDVTKGATYFHNVMVRPRWTNQHQQTVQIGKHLFWKAR